MKDDALEKARTALDQADPLALPVTSLGLANIAVAQELRRLADQDAAKRLDAIAEQLKAFNDRMERLLVLVKANLGPAAQPQPPSATPASPPAGSTPAAPPTPPTNASTQTTTRSTPPTRPQSPAAGPPGTKAATCGNANRPGCGATIYWGKKIDPQTGETRNHPFDADGTSHFKTCPAARNFRGGR